MAPFLDESTRSATSVRVLTWHHDTDPAAIEAFRRHLGESDVEPARTAKQVRQAALDWRALQSKYGNLQVREYRSAPTMQGLIVKGRYALIELMPYKTHPPDRPALLLRPRRDSDLFELLCSRYEQLWNDSEREGAT